LYLCPKILNFGVLFFSNTKLLIFRNFYFIIEKSLNSFIMKKLFIILFTFFISDFYAQITIPIKDKNIRIKEKVTISKDPRSPLLISKIRTNRLGIPLNGRYKVKQDKNNYYIAYFKKGRHNTKGEKSIVKYYKEGKIDKIYIYRDNNFILLSQSSFKEDKIILFMFNINDINEEEPFELTIEGDKLETIFKDNKTNRDILEYIKNNKLK